MKTLWAQHYCKIASPAAVPRASLSYIADVMYCNIIKVLAGCDSWALIPTLKSSLSRMSTITTLCHGQSLTHRPFTRAVSQRLTFLLLWLNAGPKAKSSGEMKSKCFAILYWWYCLHLSLSMQATLPSSKNWH